MLLLRGESLLKVIWLRVENVEIEMVEWVDYGGKEGEGC